MGYIPTYTPKDKDSKKSTQDFQTDGMFQDDGRGEVFRYEQTGKTEPDEDDGSDRYSEIGFYHRKTQWETKDNAYCDVEEEFPRMDQLNIQSTGDIYTAAKNHHRVKAKRIEILSNLNGTDFSKDLKGENRPFGDKGPDESRLFRGDIHIRAKNRIVIKAGTEIRLEVGRSTVLIDDYGVKISARKTHARVPNDGDATLSVLPLNGIQGTGQHINFASQYHFSISEKMGSGLSGIAGIMRLGGKDIKLSTTSSIQYITAGIGALAATIGQIGTMSRGMSNDDAGGDVLDNLTLASLAPVVGPLIGQFAWGIHKGAGLEAKDDTDSLIYTIFTKLLQFMGMILGIIESMFYPDADDKTKDNFALTGIIAELCCIIPIFVLIFSRSLGPFMLHNGWVHMDNNGQLVFGGVEEKKIYIRGMDAQSALAGLQQDTGKKLAENEKKRQELQEKKGELSLEDTEKFDKKNAEIMKDAKAQEQTIKDQRAGAGLDEQSSMLKGESVDATLINAAKTVCNSVIGRVLAGAVGAVILGVGAGVGIGVIMPFLSKKTEEKEKALDELDAL
jgi:hypothetical protein